MPKAQLSGEDDEEPLDEKPVGERPWVPPSDEGWGSPDSDDGVGGVPVGDDDDDEKERFSEESPGEGSCENPNPEVNSGEKAVVVGRGPEESAQGGVSGDVSKDDTLTQNPVDGEAAVTELSASVGSGDMVVAGVEGDGVWGGVFGSRDEKDVGLGGDGSARETRGPVTAVAGDSVPLERAQFDVGVVVVGEETDVQDEKEEALGGSGSEEAEVIDMAEPVEAEESGGMGVSEEVTSPVTEVAPGANPVEEEIRAASGQRSGGMDSLTVLSVEGNSDAKEIMEETEKDEALDSSEIKQSMRKDEKDGALEGVAPSIDIEEDEDSVHRLDGVASSEATCGTVPLETERENQGLEEEKALAEIEAKSDEAEAKLDTDGGSMNSGKEVELLALIAEDSKNEQVEREAVGVSAVSNGGNALVISASHSDLKDKAGGSQVAEDVENIVQNEVEGDDDEEEGFVSNGPAKVAILGSSETAKQIVKGLEEGSSGTSSSFGSSRDYSRQIDGQIVSDFDEKVETDEEGDEKELFDSAALVALLKAATGLPDSSITITAPDATRIFSVDRPAGLGSTVQSLKPAPPRPAQSNIFSSSDHAVVGELENMDGEEKRLQEKVEQIRVKFLRLIHRLGHSPENTVAAQVLYHLGLAEGIRHGRQTTRAFSLENAKRKALQLEEDGEEPLDCSCNILVLGKTGVGKSATINSIFGEQKVQTNAFAPATTSVKEITGTVYGIWMRVIDTPGLRLSVMDQTVNKRILSSIKKYTKKCPPDVVLYVERLDTQTRDFNDLPLLRSITSTLGSSIWFNSIIALTHAASAPPEGPSGFPLSYDVFIAQRSHAIQHSIRQAAGDMRLMSPVALVENHPSCRRNRDGQRVLPNGLSWRPQILLLCYSLKILYEANSLLKLQDPSPGKLFGFRVRSPPLPYLLSSLLQSRAHPKLATDQGGENVDSDIDLSDSDREEEEDEYDQLPSFKPLRKAQIAKLTKEQRKAYFDEYDYRVKLLQKQQWKEELRRLKEMRKRGKKGQDELVYGDMADDYDQDGDPAMVPVSLSDMVLPLSFDCDNPAYRYRFLETTSQLLARPVLGKHVWDHDCGYDGVNLEENLAIADHFPAAISVQIMKDKKDFTIHLDSSVSTKHGENGSTLAGFDIQSVGKQLAYILRGETKFKNLRKNKTAAGVSVTLLGENIATGLKVEDQLLIGKRVSLVATSAAIRAQGDVAYGANLEVRLREKDFPIGQDLSTLGLSLLKWHGDLALGANLHSQFSVGQNSKMAVRVGLNNKLSGQIEVRTSSSEQLQIALLGLLPIAVSIYRSIWPGESYIGH